MAWGSERPERTRNSSALSSIAESLPMGRTIGAIFLMSSPQSGLSRSDSRALIQFWFPFSVLISPLCARNRKGWARSQVGKVLVL